MLNQWQIWNKENDPEIIRVLIVDDHGMVRKGLGTYLGNRPDICVVGEARDGREAVRQVEQFYPDVLLMDLVMPEMGRVAATRSIHQRWPRVQVIALTSFIVFFVAPLICARSG